MPFRFNEREEFSYRFTVSKKNYKTAKILTIQRLFWFIATCYSVHVSENELLYWSVFSRDAFPFGNLRICNSPVSAYEARSRNDALGQSVARSIEYRLFSLFRIFIKTKSLPSNHDA